MLDRASGSNLREILRSHTAHQGDKVAFTFLPDQGKSISMTYGELYKRARMIGQKVSDLTKAGDRVLLAYPPGLEYVAAFFGCIYSGRIAIPVYPPRKGANGDRLPAIIRDCQAELVLTADAIGKYMTGALPFSDTNSLRVVPTDQFVIASEVEKCDDPEIAGHDIAFLQYTSGSTAAPRGVMVSHDNLMHNLAAVREAGEQSGDTVLVSWLPIYHDMGLIGNILSAIYVGGHCVFMSPSSFIQQPVRWLEAISHYRGTYSTAPNFAYDLCVEKVRPEQKVNLDLSTWKVAMNGAEPIRPSTNENFVRAFASVGFGTCVIRTCYGLAEGTLAVSCSKRQRAGLAKRFDTAALEQDRALETVAADIDPHRVLTSSGQAIQGQQIAIVNPASQKRCAPDEVGEIWVAGPSICQGYWGNPQLGESIFRACIRDTGEGPFLRTGDLGFLNDGDLYITGRLKDLVIIRGRNHYPQDIEFTIEQCHPAIRPGCGAAFSIAVDGQEQLAIVCEIRRSEVDRVDLEEVALKIHAAVGERHELDVSALEFVKPNCIPKTSSGKIQRSLCREKFLSGQLECLVPTAVLTRGAPVSLSARKSSRQKEMEFSLFYFSSNAAEFEQDKYRLFIEGAKFADEHDFAAVWIPERHFHPFGGIFPNPSVLAAALAMTTKRIRLRAGSVVLPLHSPVRVAEEWAVVDNLSDGRVDIAFARGWNPNDFVLAPANYQNSLDALYQGLRSVLCLWEGGSIALPNGRGETAEVRIHPQPKQAQLPTWITCSGGVERFIEAGTGGWHVLTALLFQSIEELAAKIAAYRDARQKNGHDPQQGRVTLMLHTFLGTDDEEVKRTVRRPFIEYLKTSTDLWRHGSKDLNELSEREREIALDFAFERYYRTSGLFGTPETCVERVAQLEEAGVDEIACLIDFGVETDQALQGLHALNWLQGMSRGTNAPRTPEAVAEAATGAASGKHSRALAPGAESPSNGAEAELVLSQQGSARPEDAELRQVLKDVIVAAISRAARIDVTAIPSRKHFLSLGLNSLKAMEVVHAIEQQVGLAMPHSMLFEFPTVDSLSQALVREHRDQLIARL